MDVEKKICVVKIIDGTEENVFKVGKLLSELKKEKSLENLEFLISNDKIEFMSAKQFLTEMEGIVDEVRKLVKKEDVNVCEG